MRSRTLTEEPYGTIDALRRATRSNHAALAAQVPMARLFDASYTLEEYRAHLCRLIGLFEPLERAVAQMAPPLDPARLHLRSHHLRYDLHAMGATAGELRVLERCDRIPRLDPAGLRGYSYVVLGSALGGKLVVAHLGGLLGPAASFRFYGGAEGRVEKLWDAFCLDLQRDRSADVAAICDTAISIFDLYAEWIAGASTVSRTS